VPLWLENDLAGGSSPQAQAADGPGRRHGDSDNGPGSVPNRSPARASSSGRAPGAPHPPELDEQEVVVVQGLDDPSKVATPFRWPAALGGSEVFVTGSFCGWERMMKMHRAGNGDFFLTMVRSLSPRRPPDRR